MNTANFRSLTDHEIDAVAGAGFYLGVYPSGFTHAAVKVTGTGIANAEAAAVPGVVAISIAQAQGMTVGDTAFATATAQA